ncbi:MAG: hypothetical protein WD097_03475 [Balneolales bacterium]
MEKKLNMSSVDELCVKYVFDELDPSENILVEQAMIDDQNLLIEVESLKSTWRKLKKMPELQPSENLTDAILSQAREHANQQQFFFGRQWKNPGLMATAAVVLFSLSITTAYLLPRNNHSEPATAGTQWTMESHAAAMNLPSVYSLNERENNRDQISPWIDRSNMIYLGSTEEQEMLGSRDSLNINGFRNLRTNRHTVVAPSLMKDIHLTGTQY